MIEYYTYVMGVGEAGDKDSINSLFEPMPAEALLPNPFLPPNEPLSPTERRDALEWLLTPSSDGGGGISVKLLAPYDRPDIRDNLIESMLLNSWFLPDSSLGNQIPLQAGSGHKVGSSTIPLELSEDHPRRVDVVIKPFHQKHTKAEREMEKLKDVQQRGIPVIEPFGILDITDNQGRDTYMLTILKKSIVPLQKINFEQLDIDHKFTQLKSLLASLATFVATMHNKGVAHQDLHLGNIAMDLSQENANEFVIFDLEKSTIMPKDKLGKKNKLSQSAEEDDLRTYSAFENLALKDVATVAAEIAGRNDKIAYDTILHTFVFNYIRARTQSHGRFNDQEFIEKFDKTYKTILRKVRKMAEWQRNNLAELIPNETIEETTQPRSS